MNIVLKDSPDDTRLILQLAKDCCADHGDEALGGVLDIDHYEREWKALLSSGNAVMFGAMDDAGKMYGGIGGCVSRVMLTGKLRAMQIFWYVDKAHRNGLTAIRLLDRFEAWAKAMGCATITMPVNAGMSEHAGKVYWRRGYRSVETTYRKAL